ncbi:hypothetical protein MKZ02_22030 [Pseudobacillus sp. FSL P4-0506]|uniref:hypothetical protein n=1 Tax=unclassified Pseudobacillus TaxID=2619284 RepID=UPI0030FA5EC1
MDSAIHRPFQTMFGEPLYKDIFEKAADITVDFVTGKITFDELVSITRQHSYRKSF